MEIFVLDHEIACLEKAQKSPHSASRLADLVALSWHLRQRDTRRALALADETEAMIKSLSRPAKESLRHGARLQLVRAEANFLFLELEAANAATQLALDSFSSQNDLIGCADCHRMLALIADERGNFSDRDAALETARDCALRAGDQLRIKMAEIAIAFFAISRNPQAETIWRDRVNGIAENGHPAVTTWVSAIRGTCAILSRDFSSAISCGILAYENAMQTGQIRFAIKTAIKVGFAFSKLSDHQAALLWMQRGLALAKPAGWPESVGLCLCHTIAALRKLGQSAAAQSLVDEVLGAITPFSDSYSHSRILLHHGQLALERGDHAAALSTFVHLEQRADRLSQSQFQIESRRGQAHALSCLARSVEARVAALTSLALAQMQGDLHRELSALQLLAEIYSVHTLPVPEGMNAPSTALFFLSKALAVAENIDGLLIPTELLDALAREYAKVDDFANAYKISLRSLATRDETQHRAADMHAIALEARGQAERAIAHEEDVRQQQAVQRARSEKQGETSDSIRGTLKSANASEERNDVLTQFLAAANHRLRQPIHAMNLCIGALALHNLPPKARPLLDNLRQCAHELSESFLSLLDLSRLQSNMVRPHCEPFPIMALLSRIKCEYLALASAKGLDFYVVPSNAWVESDPLLVEQILRNLVAHAMRFSRVGKIRIGCRRKGNVLRVAIYNTCVGMPPDPNEVMSSEITEFVQRETGSDELGMGMGMGMAIAKRLGHLLGLPIDVKSELGKGAIFAVDLPLAEQHPPKGTSPVQSIERFDFLFGKFIVVVDDDRNVLDAMRQLLERWKCTVVTASSGKEIIAKLGASDRVPEAMICDYRLGQVETGLDVIQALRVEFNQEIPALLITGESFTSQFQKSLIPGVQLFQKPVGSAALQLVLTQLLSMQKNVVL